MNILITGVAGFIGSNLAKVLLAKGHKVIGIDNFSYGRRYNLESFSSNPNFSFTEDDIKNYSSIKNINADVLVHLASQKIPRYDNSLRTLEENEKMTANVIKKCLKDKVKLVFASTSDVYGKNKSIPFSETDDLVMGPTDVKRWAYAVSKMYSEHKIIANAEANGLIYSIARFFGSYGVNQNLTWWGGPQSVFINKAIDNKAIEIHGDGLQTRTFTYVLDTVNALAKMILSEKANGEVFNVAGEPKEEISIVDLAKKIWEIIRPGEEPKLTFIPYETFGKYEDVRRRVPNINKLSSILDYEPKFSLNQGLKDAINWQKEFRSLKVESKEV